MDGWINPISQLLYFSFLSTGGAILIRVLEPVSQSVRFNIVFELHCFCLIVFCAFVDPFFGGHTSILRLTEKLGHVKSAILFHKTDFSVGLLMDCLLTLTFSYPFLLKTH